MRESFFANEFLGSKADMKISSKQFSKEARTLLLKMVFKAKASHVGGALSVIDILSVLYCEIMQVDPNNANWSDRDRLIFSKGHCCTAVYATLALKGFFPVVDLDSYGRDGSLLMSHISHHVPGVEFSTGSLGHGLPFATGLALSAKRKGQMWRTFAILSDGELDEGSNWESILFAGHHKLDNLTVIIDHNKIQSLGDVKDVLDLGSLTEKFAAFRWNAVEVDGHDYKQLADAIGESRADDVRPRCIIANTIKGKGVSFMENNLRWHYSSPDAAQLASALKEIEGAQ